MDKGRAAHAEGFGAQAEAERGWDVSSGVKAGDDGRRSREEEGVKGGNGPVLVCSRDRGRPSNAPIIEMEPAQAWL
jgi:hypothetical protein